MNDINPEEREPGCGDNSCIFACIRKRGGMRTNGGCRCFKNLQLNTNIQNAMKPTELVPYNNHDDLKRLEYSVRKLVAELLDSRSK